MCVCVCGRSSEVLSDVAVEGETGSEEEVEDTPSLSMTTASTAYSLIETAHPIFNRVKKFWNSNMESHREVRNCRYDYTFKA